MKFLMTSAAIAAMAFVPTTANAQLIGGLDNSTLLGGAVGAGLGGAIGSNLAGSGQRDEGTAIGAVVGGLAGAAYGNSRSTYAGNPYAGQFNPGFSGRTLVGTGIGAGLGGVIGSNLAGSGQRQEGTAIGAVLGGAAGYALSNRRSSAYGGAQGGYTGGGYAAGGYGGDYAPAPVNYGSINYGSGNYGPSYVTPPYPATPMVSGPTYVNSGQYISGPIMPVTRYQQPAVQPRIMSQHSTVYVPNVTYAAPNLRLAGPPIRPTVVRHTYRTEHMPIARAERVVIPASTYSIPALSNYQFSSTSTTSSSSSHHAAPAPQRADCPAGTTWQSDGTCLEKSYGGYSAPMTSRSVTLPGTFKPSVSRSVTLPGTFKPSASRMVTLPGTFEPSMSVGSSTLAGGYSSSSSSSYSSSSSTAACPAGSTRQSGVCVTSGTTSYSVPRHRPAPEVTYRAPKTTHHAPKPVRSQEEYCYAGSSKRYDSLGNEIKGGHGKNCRH